MGKYWAKYQEQYWSSLANKYDALYCSPWSQYEDNRLKERLRQIFSNSSGVVLDLGCGTGLGYRLLKCISHDIEYVGCDISDEMISQLRSNHPGVKALNMSIDDLNEMEDNSYEYVLALNMVLSLSIDVPATMNSIFRILKPNGRVFISVLNRYSLRRILSFKFGELEQFSSRNVAANFGSVPARTISAVSLARLSADHGFTDVKMWPQSVLAGVLETQLSIPLDKALLRIAPNYSHCIYFEGRKPCD